MVLRFLAYEKSIGLFEPDFIDRGGMAHLKIGEREITSLNVMQYTGLIDIKGKGCYTKQIVRAFGSYYKVVYSEGMVCAVHGNRFRSLRAMPFEIMGNVNQNPELHKYFNDK